MADTHPYISGAGNIVLAVNHLRKAFPSVVSSETIKKLGIASNNESYVINTLRFVGVIDAEGKKTAEAGKFFSQHQDETFAKGFEGLVKRSYKGLFDLHGDSAWGLSDDELITFFRNSDDTSDLIGRRQAGTFKALSGLAGHAEIPTVKAKPRTNGIKDSKPENNKKKQAKASVAASFRQEEGASKSTGDLGLTVRIEINLPAQGDQETYDRIFKSIRENLLNG